MFRNTPFRALSVEALEAREVPASLQFVFDYRYDTTGFFSDPTRRAALEQAGAELSGRLNVTTDLAAITPVGANTWSATTFNPANPTQTVSVSNLAVGTDQLVVFAAGQAAGNNGEAGLGGYGGYSASGTSGWFDTLRTRGRGGFAAWGGSIGFDSGTNWSFDGTPTSRETDFYTVAVHELGHVLGFGVSNQWNALASGSQFTGANARAANGGTNAPLATNEAGHWRQGTTSNGQPVSMQPYVAAGTRVRFSDLDYAALADIGWEVSAAGTSPGSSAGNGSTGGIPTSAQTGTATPLVVGGSNGTFQVYTLTNGTLTPVGGPVTPFPGFGGSIRTTTGDFDRDGAADVAVAAGPGATPAVKVFSGRSGQEILSFFAYETNFGGGVVLAAGDFTGDGYDDLVVGADQGGGPRVRIFNGMDITRVPADFWGIADANFRGGVRIAAGDLNGDGRADLVVAAGPGGGPRVAIYDGSTVAGGAPNRLTGDFYAFDDQMANGCYVAVADADNDGFADILFGAGSGVPRVRVASGRVLMATSGNYALHYSLGDYTVGSPAGYTGGARVAAGDYDGDGWVDLVAGLGEGSNGQLTLDSRATDRTTAVPFGNVWQREGVFVG